MRIILCFAVAGTCIVPVKKTEYARHYQNKVPVTITFNREVIQRTQGDDGNKTVTMEAFKVQAVNCLLKPIDEDDLKDVINDGGYLIMANNQRIPISHSKRNAIIDVFESLRNDS